jgi:hypothetical protein
VESSCEHSNKPSGSIRCWETAEWLHNLWPLEWYVRFEVFMVVTMKNGTQLHRVCYLMSYIWGE